MVPSSTASLKVAVMVEPKATPVAFAAGVILATAGGVSVVNDKPVPGEVEPAVGTGRVAEAMLGQGQAVGVQSVVVPVGLDRPRLLEPAGCLVKAAGAKEGYTHNVRLFALARRDIL